MERVRADHREWASLVAVVMVLVACGGMEPPERSRSARGKADEKQAQSEGDRWKHALTTNIHDASQQGDRVVAKWTICNHTGPDLAFVLPVLRVLRLDDSLETGEEQIAESYQAVVQSARGGLCQTQTSHVESKATAGRYVVELEFRWWRDELKDGTDVDKPFYAYRERSEVFAIADSKLKDDE